MSNDKPTLNELRKLIISTLVKLANENFYSVPEFCKELGIEPTNQSDNLSSEIVFLQDFILEKSEDFIINLAQKILKKYPSVELSKMLSKYQDNQLQFSLENRQNLIDELLLNIESGRNIYGKLDLITFLKRIYELDDMPLPCKQERRFQTATEQIEQHMVNFPDWEYSYLFDYLGLKNEPDDIFFKFLEQVTHPVVQEQKMQIFFVELINNHLFKDGFRLESKEQLSGLPIYQVVKISSGVSGNIKQLIFASNGEKPQLVLEDAINNHIRIVKHEDKCLVYDQIIPTTGLLWKDLVSWWAKKVNHETINKETEDSLYERLSLSLSPISPPEKLLFETYYTTFGDMYGDNLPALIPQVYLHYDPYTLKELPNKRIARQRMDFLILFSTQERVVIEVDGKQHYADGEIASTQKYSEMVAEDRKLKLAGYEIYRFGGYELRGELGKNLVIDFFNKIFEKYNIRKN
jgi:very-short-patch-repair endonuclease